MKKFRIALSFFLLITGFATAAHADLDDFIRRVNQQAREDISRFNVKLSAQFGIPVPKIDEIIKRVPTPADAFMVLQLGQMANRPPDTVLHTYESNRGQGWGAIAKDLGIKPGSPEFHALKRGDFAFTGQPGGGAGKEHGKGKGKKHNR
jgi:hypothetical protein